MQYLAFTNITLSHSISKINDEEKSVIAEFLPRENRDYSIVKNTEDEDILLVASDSPIKLTLTYRMYDEPTVYESIGVPVNYIENQPVKIDVQEL